MKVATFVKEAFREKIERGGLIYRARENYF